MIEEYIQWDDNAEVPDIRFYNDRVYGWSAQHGVFEVWPTVRAFLIPGYAAKIGIPGNHERAYIGPTELITEATSADVARKASLRGQPAMRNGRFYPVITPWWRARKGTGSGLSLAYAKDTESSVMWTDRGHYLSRVPPYGSVSELDGVSMMTARLVPRVQKITYSVVQPMRNGACSRELYLGDTVVAAQAWASPTLLALVQTLTTSDGYTTRLAAVYDSRITSSCVAEFPQITDVFRGDMELTQGDDRLVLATERITYVFRLMIGRANASSPSVIVGPTPVASLPIGGCRISIDAKTHRLAIWAKERGKHIMRIVDLAY